MPDSPRNISEYHRQLGEALGDDFLRKTLDDFVVSYKVRREKVFKGVDEWGLKAQVAEAKDGVSRHIEELYAKFKAEAEKRGVIVHRAATAAEACEIIGAIAKENNVKSVVKSKSMTAEEIQLNPYLEKQGLEVTETDLGEWIIQLRHEHPSHMVMVAIHLSRYQVADDFTRETGVKQDAEDIQKLVKVARAQLRRKFIAADMGISGANFAIAENGSVAVVTNEGNARMVTTLPRVHVAVAGLEKLVPDVDTALTALQILPRNATAQNLTSYVTLVDGAGQCQANPDGRKIMHVVFVDNGRSQIAKDPLFSQIFRCVRCGACANVCPVYRLVGGHRMGYIYIGAIGLVLTYLFHGHDKARYLCQNCVGCEACKNVCSGGIDLPRLIREIRGRLAQEDGGAPLTGLLAAVMKNRTLFHRLLKYAKFAQKPLTGGTPYVRHLPTIFLGQQGFKALPAIADESFRDRWPGLRRPVENPRFRVALFGGCAQDFVYPEHLAAALKVLYARGVAVDYPEAQTCCGLPLDMLGRQEAAREVARQNVEAFRDGHYDAIITLCASCASQLKRRYVELLAGGPLPPEEVEAFADRITDFSSFAYGQLGLRAEDFRRSGEKTAYHSACHMCRGLGVTEPPRRLIEAAAEYAPSAEEDVCCGFGGTYSMKFPEISAKLLNAKLAHLQASGASRVVMDCPGCIMQIRGGAEKGGLPLKVSHIAELLAENIK